MYVSAVYMYHALSMYVHVCGVNVCLCIQGNLYLFDLHRLLACLGSTETRPQHMRQGAFLCRVDHGHP